MNHCDQPFRIPNWKTSAPRIPPNKPSNANSTGEEFVITRAGVCVARLVPAPRANGKSLNKLAKRWAGNIGLDAEFEAAVESIDRHASADADSDPWES